jgi:hypothetical protein
LATPSRRANCNQGVASGVFMCNPVVAQTVQRGQP